MRLLLLAALAAGLAVASAHADTYEDKSLPFAVQAPAGFTIKRVEAAGYDLALRIDPAGDFPRRPNVGDGPRLCDLRFKAAAPSAETQASLNARWKDEEALARVRFTFRTVLADLRSETAFTLGDVVGREYVGVTRLDPTIMSVTSLAYTPRGEVQMSCFVLAEQADKALPVLRSIRQSIKPPK